MRIERFVDTPHTTDVTLICHNGGLQLATLSCKALSFYVLKCKML